MMSVKAKLFHFFLRHPRLATVLRRASYYRWRASVRMSKSSDASIPDPDQILRTAPDSISKYVGGKLGNRYRTRGTVVGGDWDLELGEFEGWDVYVAIRDHYTNGTPWKDTAYYERAVEHIKEHGLLRGESEPDAVFDRIDALYRSIESNGFQPMADAVRLDYKHWEELDQLAAHDDVTVAIDRKGRFALQDGKHRLAIARVLGIQQIPVAVGARHQEWIEFRNEVNSYCSKRGSAYQPFTHPDLQDFPVHHNDTRVHTIAERLPAEAGSLLDLGAYFGYFCCCYSKLGWNCTAVEHHPMHAYFIKRLADAEDLPIEVQQMSLFDLPQPITMDVVLALNIFHHYLKTEELFDQLTTFVKSLKGSSQIFLETHEPGDPIMQGSFVNFEPKGFAEFVSTHAELGKITELCETTRGRKLFLLERHA
jgi:Methyltransferase domain